MSSPANPAALALARFRKQARELLRAALSGQPAALAQVRAVPRLAGLDDADLPGVLRLADCLHVIARGAGAESWPKLKQRLEGLDPRVIPAEQFLLAVADGEGDRARALLSGHPTLGQVNLFAAAATADLAALDQLLGAGPPSPRHPRNQWTPLLFLASSPLHADSPESSERFLQAAVRLLDAGADPNEHTRWSEDEARSHLTVLYRAVLNDNAPLVRLLLERGADPNDGESIHHGAERNHRACLELLAAHGTDVTGPDPHWGNTPLYYLAGHQEGQPVTPTSVDGMAWLLEHGADPNVTSGAARETPLHQLVKNRRGRGVLTLLLDSGADPDARRADGRTPYQLAVRAGHRGAAELLRERGADPRGVTPLDEFLGVAMQGQRSIARALLDSGAVTLSDLSPEDRGLLVQAVHENNTAALEALLELGFDPAWETPWGGTALHQAAWLGRIDLVRRLLESGAPVNARDSRFGSSPLAWAAHGSSNCRKADDDYLAVVDLLLDAGSNRESSINKWNEPPESMASPRVAGHLRKRVSRE